MLRLHSGIVLFGVVYLISLDIMMIRVQALALRSTFSSIGIKTSPSTNRHQTINRFYHHGRSLSSTKVPTVEVSPSDHGKPLTSFVSSDSILDKRLINTLQYNLNITIPTPIQSHCLPLLQNKHDIMASSATGSGKTLMFCLPLLNHLLAANGNTSASKNNVGMPTALIISPTRELAVQTAEVLNGFTKSDASIRSKINVCLATGGSDSRSQRKALPNCNVLVGTPGRICQFIDERNLGLQSVDYLVIDEADRLLDLGFEKDLTRISRSFSRNNQNRQSILCSATFPEGVQRLASDFLQENYYFVSAGKVGSTTGRIKQQFEWADIYSGKSRNNNNPNNNNNPKLNAVIRNVDKFLKSNPKKDQASVLVFSNTKDDTELIGKAISKKLGNNRVRVIHGDKQQSDRNRAIGDFKSGKVQCLVATDVAARGLDVSSIGFVLQADAPRDTDTYTHRIGRTGRAGRSGETLTLLDSKSGFRIAAGLCDLLTEAGQYDYPTWLQGQAHIANARAREEDMLIQAGSSGVAGVGVESDAVTNDEFSQQDFRRTAVAGSYGSAKDTAYRGFEDDAYSVDLESIEQNITTTAASTTSVSSDEKSEDLIVDEAPSSFVKRRPSQQLMKAISDITGSGNIGERPDKKVMNALGRNQLLKFEYIGLFPFNDISPLLMTSSNDNSNKDQVKILMVAEKPSIAQAIAEALSGNRGPRQRRGISRALPVYEFTTDKFMPKNGEGRGSKKCLIRVTSVVGHVYSLAFDFGDNNNGRADPREYFKLPVTKKEESTTVKLRVVDHLRALAGDSDHLVLWLDCDAEGENIAHEVMAVTRKAIHSNLSSDEDTIRIHRAKFSAITPKALQDAFSTLEQPDPDLSRSVDARQELDLRIGVALTRLLTWKCINTARKRFSSSTRMISYGPCQTPALSFTVDRLREIESFQTTKYWKAQVSAQLSDGKSHPLKWRVPTKDIVEDTRYKQRGNEECGTYNHQAARDLIDRANGSDLIVKSVSRSTETINPPVGLNTVALLEAGSKAMGMSPKQVMNLAEKLYSAGLISYPRTETTRYDPLGFDANSMLSQHIRHPEWGKSANYLLRNRKNGKPPKRGQDKGDHPPITPLKSATRDQVSKIAGGGAYRVYEFVVRNLIGSLHNELSFTRTTAKLGFPNNDEEEFELELVTVDSLGFADSCRWVLRDIGATSGRDSNPELVEGQHLKITKATLDERKTRPPTFLQEYELIRLMDENRIGTDASMAVHVTNIVDRGYVILCDETGVPLRPPGPPGKRKNLPRQVGRYLVPTPLGSSLLDLFNHDAEVSDDIESPALLSHPSIRRQMEEEVKEIAKGNIDKDAALIKNLDWFEDRYVEMEESLTRERVGEFGNKLASTNEHLRYLQKLDAFEPKLKGTVQNKQHHKKKPSHKKRQPVNKARYKGKQGQKKNPRRKGTKINQ